MRESDNILVTTDSEILDLFYEDIRKARARGVTDIRIIIEDHALEDEKFTSLLQKYAPISEIRSRDQVFGTSVIIDEGEDAFIVLSQKFFKKLSYFGVVTDHIAFGPAAMFYFSYLYNTANEVEL